VRLREKLMVGELIVESEEGDRRREGGRRRGRERSRNRHEDEGPAFAGMLPPCPDSKAAINESDVLIHSEGGRTRSHFRTEAGVGLADSSD
jgi:hypothetical protein